MSVSVKRLAGYRDALEGLGMPFLPSLVSEGAFTFSSGLAAADKLLDERNRPTAIFASNDDMAAAVIATALRRGLRVPADLTVCGFDDTRLATTISPEMTTVRQSMLETAEIAISVLDAALKRRSAPEGTINEYCLVNYRLMHRGSEAPPT